MTAKIYTLSLIAGLFLLWGWFSDWDPDLMIFWEGHDSNSCLPILFFNLCGYHARLILAFILIIVAFVTAMSQEQKRP